MVVAGAAAPFGSQPLVADLLSPAPFRNERLQSGPDPGTLAA